MRHSNPTAGPKRMKSGLFPESWSQISPFPVLVFGTSGQGDLGARSLCLLGHAWQISVILAPCGSTGIQLLLFLGLAADFVRNVSCENEVFIIIQFRLASLSMEPIPIFSMVISFLSAHSFIYLMNARAMGHFRILGIGLELACNWGYFKCKKTLAESPLQASCSQIPRIQKWPIKDTLFFFFIRTFFIRTLRPRFTKILRTC